METEQIDLIDQVINFLQGKCNEVTTKKDNLHFNQLSKIAPDYVVAEIYGGLNGRGEWTDYLQTITNLFKAIRESHNCWLISLENDCLDDVFTLKIGVSL